MTPTPNRIWRDYRLRLYLPASCVSLRMSSAIINRTSFNIFSGLPRFSLLLTHRIYIELAEQYALMDAASNVVKRNVLADHLREVIGILEEKVR